MNIKYPKTMQIEVRIVSSEPRNISITMFGLNKYHEHGFSFIWTQKYHFWQYSDPKIWYLPPRMCMCWVPPWVWKFAVTLPRLGVLNPNPWLEISYQEIFKNFRNEAVTWKGVLLWNKWSKLSSCALERWFSREGTSLQRRKKDKAKDLPLFIWFRSWAEDVAILAYLAHELNNTALLPNKETKSAMESVSFVLLFLL